jgi:Domain of unknown function (DUF4189)
MTRRCTLSLLLLLLGGVGAARADLYNFGAVAFDQDSGAFSYSYNFRSRQEAKIRALEKCQGKCTVIGEYWNNCGSLAAAKDGSYGWDADVDESVATGRALANCNQFATGCQTKVTVCNDVPEPLNPVSPRTDSGRIIGRHGCWYADGSRVIGCKD